MKKYIAGFLMMIMMAAAVPMIASAQTRRENRRTYKTRQYREENKNVYDKHRNLINIGIGAGAGALLGALLGGKKGAAWGAAAGAGAGTVYTYKIKPKNKNKRYYRR